jgi:hypothetical protein
VSIGDRRNSTPASAGVPAGTGVTVPTTCPGRKPELTGAGITIVGGQECHAGGREFRMVK